MTTTFFEVRRRDGSVAAVHRRDDGADGKRMSWLSPDGTLGLNGTPTAELPLYGVHLLDTWDETVPLVVCEGERCADALRAVGIPAVATVTGAASTPSAAVLADLSGRAVVCWPDADEPGRAHMRRVADSLRDVAAVAWLEPPIDAPKGWDAADYLAEHSADDVRALLATAVDVDTIGPRAAGLAPFPTAADLAAEVPAEWHYVARPWLAHGTITELDGRPKSAGKTTLVLHLLAAVLDGAPFLGEPTERTSVVLLTEQSRRSLVPSLRALSLDRADLLILTWPDAIGSAWPDVVDAAVAECLRVDAGLLIVDTLSPFVGLAAEAENDAATALAAMAPLQAAAQAHDLAVLVTRHDRKGSGEVAESGRGSNAWSGAVDCVVALRRQANPARPGIRELEAISRRDDVPDEPVVIELTDAGYVRLGSTVAVAFDEARAAVLECLSIQQDVPLDGQTLDELAEATERSRQTVRRAVLALEAAGSVTRDGKGVAKDPYRYSLAASGPGLSIGGRPYGTDPPSGQTFPSEPTTIAPSGVAAYLAEVGTDAAWSRVAPSVEDDYPASAWDVEP